MDVMINPVKRFKTLVFNSPPKSSSEKKLLNMVFQYHPRKDFNIRTSAGETIRWSDNPKFTLVVNDPRALKRIILCRDDLEAGKAFIEKGIDIEGDLFEAMTLADYFSELKKRPGVLWDIMKAWCAV
ncbi:MAG: hypothetical protein ACLFPX_07385 [Candidatus Omnitrophota bacterium]